MKATIRYGTCIYSKAGRLVGLADCYAVIVIADNATFLLALNRIAAFRPHSAIISYISISSRGSVGRASAHQLWGRGFEAHTGQDFFSWLCPLWHARSVRNYPASVLAERATPKPHSLNLFPQRFIYEIFAVRMTFNTLPVVSIHWSHQHVAASFLNHILNQGEVQALKFSYRPHLTGCFCINTYLFKFCFLSIRAFVQHSPDWLEFRYCT